MVLPLQLLITFLNTALLSFITILSIHPYNCTLCELIVSVALMFTLHDDVTDDYLYKDT